MIKDDKFFAKKYIKKLQKRYEDLQAKKEGYNVSIKMTENYIREQTFIECLIDFLEPYAEDCD